MQDLSAFSGLTINDFDFLRMSSFATQFKSGNS